MEKMRQMIKTVALVTHLYSLLNCENKLTHFFLTPGAPLRTPAWGLGLNPRVTWWYGDIRNRKRFLIHKIIIFFPLFSCNFCFLASNVAQWIVGPLCWFRLKYLNNIGWFSVKSCSNIYVSPELIVISQANTSVYPVLLVYDQITAKLQLYFMLNAN